MLYLQFRQARRFHVVRPMPQHNVYQSHPYEKWNHSSRHDPILDEEPVGGDFATTYSDDNEHRREQRAPPREEQSRLVRVLRARLWWCGRPNTHSAHGLACPQHPQSLSEYVCFLCRISILQGRDFDIWSGRFS